MKKSLVKITASVLAAAALGMSLASPVLANEAKGAVKVEKIVQPSGH